MKIADLGGIALDWAVARVIATEDKDATRYGPADFREQRLRTAKDGEFVYRWSSSWAQGGPLIDEYQIDTVFDPNGKPVVRAQLWMNQLQYRAYGPTPLIAAMRCLVAAKLGEEIKIPEELTR